MNINKTIFRRYDIRGKYPAELNEEAAYNIALAFANLFPGVKTVAVGGDTRKTTPAIKQAVINGLIDGGKQVIDINIVITPVIYFTVCHFKYDAGIVVTGSHLEGIYNGIKIVLKNAAPTTLADYENIMNHILNDRMKKAETKGSAREAATEQDYINYLKSKIKINKPLKIVIDAGNGTARLLPEKIFRELGCETETIFAEPDDTAPNHIPDPYEAQNMQDLKNKVLATGADLGVGFDGDGDRVGFIDKSGYLLTGDDLLMIFTKDALKRKKGLIVADSRASMALIEEVKSQGQNITLAVGYHAAILAKIIETGAVFGGETTCHFYFPLEIYLTDDAIFAGLKLATIASEQDNFAAFVKNLPRYATSEEIFIDFPDEKKYLVVKQFTEMVKKLGYEVNDVDGARINYDNGWAIVRPANTSPFIKVKFEGRTREDLTNVAKKTIELMEKMPIIMPEERKKKLGL